MESSKLISQLIIRQPCAEAAPAVLNEFGNVPWSFAKKELIIS